MNIPLGARIIAVADTFDAITSTRSYRSASRHKIAVEALRKSAGTQLDREVVQAFLAYYTGKRPLARWAVLLTGPHRWFGELAGWFQGATAAGLKGSATAAVLTGSVLAGTAAAPAIAEHLPIHRDSVSAAEFASGRDAKSSPGHTKGLPPGLAKKDQLPPGLRKKDELPPGLAKQVSGSKKAHPNPPANKDRKIASAEKTKDASSGGGNSVTAAGDASLGQGNSDTTDADASLERDSSATIDATAASGNGNSAIKSSKK